MPYRVAPYTLMEYDVEVNPLAIAPEPILKELPLTPATARNVIGRKILGGPEFRLGNYYYIRLRDKDDGSQETILIVGPSGTGKTLIAKLLIEVMWYNGFTPIFTISRKDDFMHLDQFNIRDRFTLCKMFKEWVWIYTGVKNVEKLGSPVLGKYAISKRDIKLVNAFDSHKFKVETLYPAYAKKEPSFKLNLKFLDVWSIADMYGLSIETKYMHTLDRVFRNVWNSPNPPKNPDDFIREIYEVAQHTSDSKVRLYLELICENLNQDRHLFQDDFKNLLLKYYQDKYIVNLSFYEVEQSILEVAFISNFIREVIDCMKKISSCALIFDDIGFFTKSKSIPRILDELINVEGRLAHAGIKKILIVQNIKQLPRILQDPSIYNKIFYSKPRIGWFRTSHPQFQCELVDNDLNENVLIYLRPPVIGRGT